ncbi:MAG: methionine--tRNA ligase [Candidatus Zixiibacteriota bacterium]
MAFYITTPLYYVNSDPHIGHAYTTILADVIARYKRLKGEEVKFLTGTDEHGQKVFDAAQKADYSPKEHCDIYVKRFQELWDKLNVRYDDFIRTTEKRHEKVVEHVLNDLWDKGEIYADNYEGWYCVPDERFWTEKDLVEGKCPDCGRDVVKIEEKNYFFRMSRYQDWLIKHIEDNPEFIQPKSRRNEILGFLSKDLNDLCISRPKSRLQWGIPLPFDTEYVTYVWFDALLNYISAPGYAADPKEFQKWWPADLQLMAKDIITTHAVYWPTMLKAADIEPPKTVFAHGWWTVNEKKMGKSLGNAEDPNFLVDDFGCDQFRYFLMRGMVLGQDSSYSFERMVDIINTELANNFGNMASRLFKMIGSYLGGTLPAYWNSHENDADTKIIEKAREVRMKVEEHFDSLEIDRGLKEINMLLNHVNSYLEDQKPWKLSKTDEETTRFRLQNILYTATETLRICSILLYPIMPEKMEKILSVFDEMVPPTLDQAKWGFLKSHRINKIKSLFPRIDLKEIEKHSAKKSSNAKQDKKKIKPIKEKEIIDYKDFAKLDLVVAEVLEAQKAENADKLLLLKIDIGEKKPRELVAGLAKEYTPEELVGKKVVVIANLKPAKIRGHLSRGMLLAADDGKIVSLLEPGKDIKPGSRVR